MILRKFRLRFLILISIFVIGSIFLFYQVLISDNSKTKSPIKNNLSAGNKLKNIIWPWSQSKSLKQCSPFEPLKDIDIDVVEVYPKLNFKPTFKSYWNYTFEKRYKQLQKEKRPPLEVFVVPHSHNDPGWLNTFEGYFTSLTTHILHHMLEQLKKHPDLRFLWSETSYLARWWETLDAVARRDVARLVARGQLEVVTGGWVMTDEATSHYGAMVDQLVEGHAWLRANLGAAPRNGWSVDPFGHSATMPYLLRRSGIRTAFIQRIHFGWKELLAARQQLEFLWRQRFDPGDGSSEVLCHMAPFDLYSIKHSCGPDPHVCLHFDFRRVAGEYSESRSTQITTENVKERAEALLGQYARVGSLFPHNTVLVPLGDDFRFNSGLEWEQQHGNYRRLMDFVNSRPEYNARISFGTLQEYFDTVKNRSSGGSAAAFPTLVGDFFPYGDVYADGRPAYWTGYFTTRPFMKQLSRDTQHWLRTAEILYVLARANCGGKPRLIRRLDQDYQYLTLARDALGLFQHHDATTGTSKPLVMQDYALRLHTALQELKGVVSHAGQFLMLDEPPPSRFGAVLTSRLFPDLDHPAPESLPRRVPLELTPRGRRVVLFNPLASPATFPVRLRVRTPALRVLDPRGHVLASQINPVWGGDSSSSSASEISGDTFELLFLTELPALSLSTFNVIPVDYVDPESRTVVYTFLGDQLSASSTRVFEFPSAFSEADIVLESPRLKATFSKQTGFLQSMELKEPHLKQKVINSYGAYKSLAYHSGAYLFQPDPESPLANLTKDERFPQIRLVRGPLCSEVTVELRGRLAITHRIYQHGGALGGALELEVFTDLSRYGARDLELFLRLKSDIASGSTFHTDANGFQMLRRNTLPGLPLEANFYPASTAAYVEDDQSRLTLLVSHAMGVASLSSGWLDAMLDRRMRFDDNRGLSEGVQDNRPTRTGLWLVLEPSSRQEDAPGLTPLAHHLSLIQNHPAISLVADGKDMERLKPQVLFLSRESAAPLHLLSLRTLPAASSFQEPSSSALLIAHHLGNSCQDGEGVNATFPELRNLRLTSLKPTSLTGLYDEAPLSRLSSLPLAPMTLQSFKLVFA